jgi:hypothetical protein
MMMLIRTLDEKVKRKAVITLKSQSYSRSRAVDSVSQQTDRDKYRHNKSLLQSLEKYTRQLCALSEGKESKTITISKYT